MLLQLVLTVKCNGLILLEENLDWQVMILDEEYDSHLQSHSPLKEQ